MPHASSAASPSHYAQHPAWLVLLGAIAVLGGIGLYGAFRDYIFEDSYITYRYADNLARGLGFSFTPGERVLGTTTPLYTLWLALWSLLGVSVEVAADITFAGAIAATAWLGGLILRHLGYPVGGVLFAVLIVLGWGDTLQFWGMETPLYTAFLLGTVLCWLKGAPTWAAVCVACAFLTRYDAAMMVLPFFALLTIQQRRIPWKPGLVALALVTPWLAFATVYFGSPLPNTLGAKTGDTSFLDYLSRSGLRVWNLAWKPLGQPIHHLEIWRQPVLILNVLVGIGAILGGTRVRRVGLPLVLLIAYPLAMWGAYSVIGPHLNFGWYLIPAAIFVLLVSVLGWSAWLGRLPVPATRFAVLAVLLVGFGWKSRELWSAEAHAISSNDQYRQRVWAYGDIAQFIRRHDLSDLVLLTDEPGYLTFRSQNPAIDAAGLVTKGIFKHGDAARATSIPEIIDARRPGLVVARYPYTPPGYSVVHAGHLGMRLMMRQDLIPERLAPSLAKTSSPTSSDDPHSNPQPFPIDLSSANLAQIRADGATFRRIGYPRPMRVGEQEQREEYGFLHCPPGAGMQAAETGEFPIASDWLSFRFVATHPSQTVAQLVVDGQVVYQQGGAPITEDMPEFTTRRWPVEAWRGRLAQIRFLCYGVDQWLAFDHFQAADDPAALWQQDFSAGAEQPAWPWQGDASELDFVSVGAQVGALGLQPLGAAVGSYGREGAWQAHSPAFALEGDRLTFVWSDYAGACRVELWVQGALVRSVEGQGLRATQPVQWDVSPWRGQSATLRLIDPTPEAHAWTALDEMRLD